MTVEPKVKSLAEMMAPMLADKKASQLVEQKGYSLVVMKDLMWVGLTG